MIPSRELKAASGQQTTTENPKAKQRTENMTLNLNAISLLTTRSVFDDSFLKTSWEDGWMIPSRRQFLRNPFKEFNSMFNEEQTKVDEDDVKMELRINASDYKPEELKVSVQSGRLLVEGKHEEKKEDGSAYVQKNFSRSFTLPKEAEADKIVSNLSSKGVLVVTAPKSTPAIMNEIIS